MPSQNHSAALILSVLFFIVTSAVSADEAVAQGKPTIAKGKPGQRAAKKSKSIDKPKPDREVVYFSVGDVELKLHVFVPPTERPPTEAEPANSPPVEADGKRAAMVFFFGGGWNGGSPSQFYGQSRRLANEGMLVFCAEYRTKSSHGTPPKTCVSDGKSAMRWVRSHAKELDIDPNRIAAGGGSAGGHVAAATATADAFDAPSDDSTISCKPNALALFNPVIDNGPEGYGNERVKDYWKQFSPLHNLDQDVPPTIVFLGTEDNLIPVATGKSFESKLKELGVRCDLHLYDGQGHGFFNRGESYEDTLEKTVAFMRSIGFLPKSS